MQWKHLNTSKVTSRFDKKIVRKSDIKKIITKMRAKREVLLTWIGRVSLYEMQYFQ